MRKKILIIAVCFFLAYSNFILPIQKGKAYSTFDAPNFVPNMGTSFFTGSGSVATITRNMTDFIKEIAFTALKLVTLQGTQFLVGEILGTKDGSAPFVTNWNAYLYLNPQQRTMTYMNSLFTQSTRGRASSLNYEGIGQAHDQYLKRQFKDSISPQPIMVNLRDNCKDPSQVFDGNNFRCFNAFLLPQNNPAGITMIAQRAYQSELDKEKTLADKKQVNGFISKEKNGRIITPSALLQSAFLSLDQMGTTTITNAQNIYDVGNGAIIRLAGAGLQASFGTKASQEAARQQNNGAATGVTNILNGQVNAGANAALKYGVNKAKSEIKSAIE